jgi:hypothetical protein
MTFLAIIGLIAILWILSKAFTKLGNALDKIGETLADRATFSTHVKGHGDDDEARKKIKEKIKTLSGEGTDKEYWKKIHSEIDDLTKE